MTADDTQMLIERSFYEALRLELVSRGLTPDITTFPKDESGYAAYQAAVAGLRLAQGYVVELFGTSAQVNRGEVEASRIVIDSITFVPGSFGIDPTKHIPETEPPYTEQVSHNLAFNYFVDVWISTDLKLVERLMVKALHSALSLRGNLKHYNSSEEFFIEMVASRDESIFQKGLLRKLYSFEIPDVIFYETSEIGPVVPMTEYELNTQILTYLGIN